MECVFISYVCITIQLHWASGKARYLLLAILQPPEFTEDMD